MKAELPKITCQCIRVPVLNGHTAAVFINFEKKPTKEQLIEKLVNFKGFPQEANLPSWNGRINWSTQRRQHV
ncbi:aspartate-semialdehyde dehydrogenase [Dorea longicatena]|nr:aspartate-semialdehyde dehydrogenase [Dorea longicatena]